MDFIYKYKKLITFNPELNGGKLGRNLGFQQGLFLDLTKQCKAWYSVEDLTSNKKNLLK